MNKKIFFLSLTWFVGVCAAALSPNEELYQAIKNNEPEKVEEALNKGADVNWKRYDAEVDNVFQVPCVKSLLHIAVQRAQQGGNAKIVPILIKHGADLEIKEAGGCTPLEQALGYSASRRSIVALVKAGANLGRTKLVQRSRSDWPWHPELQEALRYVSNLKPRVSRLWNFPPQGPQGVKRFHQEVKKLYEDYLDGTSLKLQILLNKPNKEFERYKLPFTDAFITEMRKLGATPVEGLEFQDEELTARQEIVQKSAQEYDRITSEIIKEHTQASPKLEFINQEFQHRKQLEKDAALSIPSKQAVEWSVGNVCPVCVESPPLCHKVFNKNCIHFVCKDCVERVIKYGKKCPYCKEQWQTL
jgi:hypothetical protein